MMHRIDTIEGIVTKINARALKLEQEGKNVSSIKAAVARAQNSIARVREVINAQKSKTYSINITTETNLGSAVSTAITSLSRDLVSTYQEVLSTRQIAKDALVALAKISGEKLETIPPKNEE